SSISILNPEAASLTIIKAIEKNKKIISIPGWIYHFTRFGQALMSVDVFDWFAGNIMGIYKTMNDFKGRK
ncbi:MAG: short-chain dehydrogenase, partial [Flavobacteriales bacterium]|nr:short-chain dehydrogenase [Flavobacteriales bacterium]